jgi:WD40 repeat protein
MLVDTPSAFGTCPLAKRKAHRCVPTIFRSVAKGPFDWPRMHSQGHNAIVNSLSVNDDGVMASGGDNGNIHMWDWKTVTHRSVIVVARS